MKRAGGMQVIASEESWVIASHCKRRELVCKSLQVKRAKGMQVIASKDSWVIARELGVCKSLQESWGYASHCK